MCSYSLIAGKISFSSSSAIQIFWRGIKMYKKQRTIKTWKRTRLHPSDILWKYRTMQMYFRFSAAVEFRVYFTWNWCIPTLKGATETWFFKNAWLCRRRFRRYSYVINLTFFRPTVSCCASYTAGFDTRFSAIKDNRLRKKKKPSPSLARPETAPLHIFANPRASYKYTILLPPIFSPVTVLPRRFSSTSPVRISAF